MTDEIIKVRGLSCQSGNRFLLHNINWTVRRGEHWLVFGMNGCGKTTLLSVVAGFRTPSAGSVEVLGERFDRQHIFDLRRRIGWVSSSFFDKYYRNELCLQIVLSGLSGTLNIDGNLTAADVRKAKALLESLGAADKANLPFYMLSKGERQNVLIARALITDPAILVLDEPGTGLDVYAREYMKNTVASLAANGKVSILYVTHYPEEIQPFMNKTLILRNGCVFAQGDTRDVMTEDKLSKLLQEPIHCTANADGSLAIKTDAVSHIDRICYLEGE